MFNRVTMSKNDEMQLFIEFYLERSLKFEPSVVILGLGEVYRSFHRVNLYAGGGYRIASVHNGAPCRGSAPDTATWIDEMQSTDGVATPRSPSSRRMAGRPASQFANVNEIIGRTGQNAARVRPPAPIADSSNWVSAHFQRTYRSIINDRDDSNSLRRSRA